MVLDPANEVEVDLNDFLGTPNDETDWNYTELSEDYCKALASKGVYYSKNKGAWVMKKDLLEEKKRQAEQARINKERELQNSTH